MIQIDPSSTVAIYDQIKAGIKGLISKGLLKAGDPVPSVRTLAVKLKVNPNTAARALRELSIEGVLESRRGTGSVVAEAAGIKVHDGMEGVLRNFGESVRMARRGGLAWEDIDAAVERAKGEEQ